MAQRQAKPEKSTIDRLEIGAYHDRFGQRDGSHRSQQIWGGYRRRPDRARADRLIGRHSARHADRLERWVAGLLTLIAAGYGIAVLARIVAMYG